MKPAIKLRTKRQTGHSNSIRISIMKLKWIQCRNWINFSWMNEFWIISLMDRFGCRFINFILISNKWYTVIIIRKQWLIQQSTTINPETETKLPNEFHLISLPAVKFNSILITAISWFLELIGLLNHCFLDEMSCGQSILINAPFQFMNSI